MKLFEKLWADCSERRRKKWLKQVTPIVLALMEEFWEPHRPDPKTAKPEGCDR